MKRFLVILLCFSSCLFFSPEVVHAAHHLASPVKGSNIPHRAGAVETQATKTAIAKAEPKQNREREALHAAAPQKSASPQSIMDAEFLALLLLIMVLGMLYTNPSR